MRNDYVIFHRQSSIICHYGIKGQKWGIRNGPPYPLEDHKTATLSIEDKAHEIVDKHKNEILPHYYDSKGFKKANNKSFEDAIKSCNPYGGSFNCKEIALAVGMDSVNGYDVHATKNGTSGTLQDFMYEYTDSGNKVLSISTVGANPKERTDKFIQRRYSDGDVGIVSITMQDKYTASHPNVPAHAINWKIDNGTVIYNNGQGRNSKDMEDGARFFNYAKDGIDVECVKLNDVKLKESAKKILINN